MIYIGIDGDDIGRNIEQYFLENNEVLLEKLSKKVDNFIKRIAKSFKEIGMKIIFSSGDSMLCKGDDIDIEIIKNLIRFNNDFRFSVGIGNTLEKTYMALKYAKVSGKNRIVFAKENGYKIIKKEEI